MLPCNLSWRDLLANCNGVAGYFGSRATQLIHLALLIRILSAKGLLKLRAFILPDKYAPHITPACVTWRPAVSSSESLWGRGRIHLMLVLCATNFRRGTPVLRRCANSSKEAEEHFREVSHTVVTVTSQLGRCMPFARFSKSKNVIFHLHHRRARTDFIKHVSQPVPQNLFKNICRAQDLQKLP